MSRNGLAHKVTDETRAEVDKLLSYGFTHSQVAIVMKISEDTLARHYKNEIKSGGTMAVASVANVLFTKCQSGDTRAIEFFLRTKGRFSEKNNDTTNETLLELLMKFADDKLETNKAKRESE